MPSNVSNKIAFYFVFEIRLHLSYKGAFMIYVFKKLVYVKSTKFGLLLKEKKEKVHTSYFV